MRVQQNNDEKCDEKVLKQLTKCDTKSNKTCLLES